jgi:GNAT superfamily N-acetyltransferase
VLVQRSAFAGSTFTVERWRTMQRSPAGGLAVEALVRTPAGEPAAAATGWFAGVGRCGLLEPVGTHPDHRGHGYGGDAVLGACAALAHQGASAVAVVAPSTNMPRWRSIDRPGSPVVLADAAGSSSMTVVTGARESGILSGVLARQAGLACPEAQQCHPADQQRNRVAGKGRQRVSQRRDRADG